MDFDLTRLPLLGGLILRTPSSDGLVGLPILRAEFFVGIKFPTLVVFSMLLAAVGAFDSRLTGRLGCLGWSAGGRRHGGEELLEHGHHVFHLLRVLCLKHVCHFSNDHGLSLGIQNCVLSRHIRNAFPDRTSG